MTNLQSRLDYSYFWKKKDIVSYLLSVLVFWIHVSSFSQYPSTGTLVSEINARADVFFRASLANFTVPMFLILSGATFFRDYDDSKYAAKLKSRFRSLMIPYLLWNTLWMLFNIVCSYTFISNYFVGRKPFVLTLENILRGIFFYGANGPFWFVFNLFVFTAASPLINRVIQKKTVGIGAVLLLSVLLLFDIGLPGRIFVYPSSIVYYLIGAILGKYHFADMVKQSSPGMRRVSVLYLLGTIIVNNFFYREIGFFQPAWDILSCTLCAWAFWNVTDAFVHKLKFRPMYTRSFAVYAMHANVSAVVTKLIVLAFPKREWMAIPNFFLTTVITLWLINTFCALLEAYLPGVSALLMGARAGKKTNP